MKKTPKSDYAAWNNRRHKVLDPETVKTDVEYTFTYNPKIQPYDADRGVLDVINWHNNIVNIVKRLQYCSLKMYPEISQGSRFHYHGVIVIKDVLNFYIFDLPILKEDSALEIDNIQDATVWKTYYTKCKHLMEPLYKKYKCPYEFNSTKPMFVKIEAVLSKTYADLVKNAKPIEDLSDDDI